MYTAGGGSRQFAFVGDLVPFRVHIFMSRVQLHSNLCVTLSYLHLVTGNRGHNLCCLRFQFSDWMIGLRMVAFHEQTVSLFVLPLPP